MNKTELQRLFMLVYNKTQQDDYVFDGNRIRSFHINPNAGLDAIDKMVLMNKCNGINKRKKSIDKILNAKAELISQNEPVTQKKVAELSGLSLRTVKKYYHVEEPIDIVNVTDEINKQYYSTITTTIIEYTSTTVTSTTVSANLNTGSADVNESDDFWMQMDSLF